MKKILLFTALLLGACENDPCKNVDCGTAGACNDVGECHCVDCFTQDSEGKCTVLKDCGVGGVCTGDTCFCADGYYKDTDGKCTLKWTTNLLGNYNGNADCSFGSHTFVTAVTEQSPTALLFSNFGNLGTTVPATLVAGDSLIINDFFDANSRTFNGNGRFTANTWTINYTVTSMSGTTDTCSAVCVRQ